MPTTHSSAQQARRLIADRLRELRVLAELAGNEHARLCGWHPAKTSRIENNKAMPSADDIRTWCRVCGTVDQTDDLIASLRAAEGMWVEWRRMERQGLRQAQEAIKPLYERTKRFRAYSPWLVSGMIQTPDYTQQVLHSIQQRRGLPDDVDEALAARVDRQTLLTEGQRVFAFILEESVLRSGVVDSTVMAGQLAHLLDIGTLPNVSLGIIPLRFGRSHLPVEGFWIYDAAQVNVELVSGYLTVTQPSEIDMYAKTFSSLADMAVYGAKMRALVTAASNAP